MIGDYRNPDMWGIAPRAIQEIFTIKAQNPSKEFEIECYMVELYRDKYYDLLNPRGRTDEKLEVKRNPVVRPRVCEQR